MRALSNGTKLSMNVPMIAYTQGGRVLMACDNFASGKGIAVLRPPGLARNPANQAERETGPRQPRRSQTHCLVQAMH
jgi:hypothetical protein